MDKFTIKAITPDSSTIICGLTDTVSNLTHFWPFVDTFQVIYLVYFQMQSIRQEKHMENKNRNNFRSVQTLVMCISSSGYDVHKYILIEPQAFSPSLSAI